MTYPMLLRLGVYAALVGGGLRLISSFIPWVEDSGPLESFYFVIDVALLFGLFAIYLARADRLGLLGLMGFAIAAVGQAMIIGPDHAPFGIDVYYVGSLTIVVGLTLLAVDMLRVRAYPVWVAAAWIAVPFVGLGLNLTLTLTLVDPSPYGWGYFLGGILFSLGFIAAGVHLFGDGTPARR